MTIYPNTISPFDLFSRFAPADGIIGILYLHKFLSPVFDAQRAQSINSSTNPAIGIVCGDDDDDDGGSITLKKITLNDNSVAFH